MTDRELILDRLPDSEGGPSPEQFQRPVQPESDLVAMFTRNFEALGGSIIIWKDLERQSERNWIVDPSVGKIPSLAGEHVDTDCWEAAIGITRADCGIAETGSTLINHKEEDHRLASLAPPIHVTVLSKANIVASLEDGIAKLGRENAVIITGPSRTADIEGVLVRGVHGPKTTFVILD